jgi:hypothetical protein
MSQPPSTAVVFAAVVFAAVVFAAVVFAAVVFAAVVFVAIHGDRSRHDEGQQSSIALPIECSARNTSTTFAT